jgi:hypothetical protein
MARSKDLAVFNPSLPFVIVRHLLPLIVQLGARDVRGRSHHGPPLTAADHLRVQMIDSHHASPESSRYDFK